MNLKKNKLIKSFLITLFFFPYFAFAITSTYQINSGSDDVAEVSTFYPSENTMWIGSGDPVAQSFQGFRFNNIDIPQGSNITSAYLRFYSVQQQWITMGIMLYGDNVANSAVFSSSNKPSQRSLTTASVIHSDDTNWSSNTLYNSNEISTVIQEIINRPDWSTGNSLSIISRGTSLGYGRKFIGSYEGGAVNAVQLVVTYTAPSVTPTPPPPTPTPTPTPPPPTDTTPPVISSVSVGSVTSSGAIITWSTNENSNSSVQYGLTTVYGSTANSGGTTSHSATLSGLSANTVYNFRVSATDTSGNTAVSVNQTFTTVATPTPPPPTPTPTPPPPTPTPTPTPPPPAGTSVDWPQLQNNSQRTGRTSAEVAPNYEVAWAWADPTHIVKNFVSAPNNTITSGFEVGFKFNTVIGQQVQPIVADSKVYFGSMNGVMYAVDALLGDNRWQFSTGGPILGSAAYSSGVVVFGSMDGKIYGLSSSNGSQIWSYQTGAGINAAPTIHNGVVYVGSRDGKFYSLNASNGSVRWIYNTRDVSNTNFNLAPIVAPAAVSEDGSLVFFGAENMNFYGLRTSDGGEQWAPKKLVGQSFLYSWPVVSGNKVIVRTMSSLEGAEFVMESVLTGLPANPTWAQEKAAILSWLTSNPNQKTMHVIDTTTGVEPYQVAMGRVTGNNYVPHLPVVDNSNRLLTYWRTKVPSFIQNGICFGTAYCPDISAMDLNTGDRVLLTNNSGNKLAPELDNGFQLTVGGNYLYFANSFRGTHSINLTNGNLTRLTSTMAHWDCGNFRGWGFNIIYYGNDGQPDCTTVEPRPPKAFQDSIGFSGVAIASINGTPMLYVNEPDAGFIVGIRHKP
jgi:hypothetical protein